ncbi:hypothetical protein ASPZODRAFT_126499 [Penicilliopsis zonata CBS 506.65]|uniref:Enoyl reductase (ER) domain-containing protein n=1 Tax=Penicilliopsis zonata CBS 506.65 TaxID=1073090 RepID=A0A1L9SU41_9EURO|nr:hypothetical protein ASPZODRAFT_126499 [Penicilliopsis zonata CBS 506.65]OJJ50607.1 hypothetical protein ASPZODRAFT_126499 [Penicilliopsis zonata CBS 506.65]
MPTNNAAWLNKPKGTPLVVKSAPYTSPGEDEIVVKNGAVAINPIDWVLQASGTTLMYSWLPDPCIMGSDVAGEVVEVGSSVTRFKVGDRVLGYALGREEKRNRVAECGFQTYTVLLEDMVTPIPSDMSYETASVIPLGFSTAACGLFQKDQLGLALPTLDPTPKGQTVLVWGGSTSVGCNGIQLAVAAGYEVFTTASPKNFDLVRKLGASQVFDYRSRTVVADIIQAFKGKIAAGALSVGHGAADACMAVLAHCEGNRFVAMATYPVPSPPPKVLPLPRTIFTYMSWILINTIKSKFTGVRYKFIFGSTLAFNEVGKAMFQDFLPDALAKGKYIAAPDPMVIGKGLDQIQAALDLHRKGVSARKIVVSL